MTFQAGELCKPVLDISFQFCLFISPRLQACFSRYLGAPSLGMHQSVSSGNAGVVQTVLQQQPPVLGTNTPTAGAFGKEVGEYRAKRNSEI